RRVLFRSPHGAAKRHRARGILPPRVTIQLAEPAECSPTPAPGAGPDAAGASPSHSRPRPAARFRAMALLAGDAGRLLRGSMLLIAGTMAGNVLNVVYTFLMARLLAPPDYAALVALISLFIVASLPAGTIQTVVAREVAIAEAAGDAGRPGAIVRRLLARLLPVALLASAGLLALA